MNHRRFRQAEALFHTARTLPLHERHRYVFEQCVDDWTLYREVMELVSRASDHDTPSGSNGDRARADSPPVALKELASTDEKYEILEVLGEGGMGIVYLANQTHPIRRRVALKVIKLGVESKRAAARFEAERQALALMSHPHIARVYEAGATADGRMFFAMEYVPGLPINEYCDNTRLTVRERLQLFVKVCQALQHAHQKGIIHRDVKPSNVLVTTEGPEPTPKVIDFGVARALNHRLTEQSLFTEMGTVVGSLRYMSPEQADCRVPDVDTRTDIYSLGAMLYELLVGETPLSVGRVQEHGYTAVQRMIQDKTVVRPSERLAGMDERILEVARSRGTDAPNLKRRLRGELDWITLKALEKDRLRRYASASEFAADIERYLTNQAVEAGPPSTGYRLKKFIQRHRGGVVATAAVAVALLLGFGTAVTLLVENRRAMRLAQQQRDEILRLSDANRLETCLASAEALYPPYPDRIDDMKAWLGGTAADLAARLPHHRATLLALAGEAVYADGAGGTQLHFADARKQFHYDVLSRLVADLERFVHPDPAVGVIASVRERLKFAETVVERSVSRYADVWDAAIRSIADAAESPAYGGLVIAPQVGLVPLGRDPDSGLWEFAHIQSGTVPARDERGRLVLDESSAIVLVLVPGGCYWMGAETGARNDPAVHSGDQNARPDEAPAHRVCLDPYFISKFEVTRGQWRRVGGPKQEDGKLAKNFRVYHRTPLHPAEGINWAEAARVARHMGMQLPTEAQWEYAARAGTSAPWPCGSDFDCVEKIANLVDQTARDSGRPTEWGYAPWHDGFVESAPVGRFAANAFGLHDVTGNVWEWCRDRYAPYDHPVSPGDAERLNSHSDERIIRGGGYNSSVARARVSWRGDMPVHSSERIGIRPVREVVYADTQLTRDGP